MKTRKLLALLLVLAFMVCLFAACGSSASTETSGATSAASSGSSAEASSAETSKSTAVHIYVLTPNADHGWTGAVAGFAQETVDAVNAAGTYTAELLTSADASEQITQIEDIVANYKGDKSVAVAMLPQDETVENAIQQLIDAGIPYTAMDRIIASVKDAAVSNIVYDNNEIGAAAAYYLTQNGLKQGDKVLVLEGNNSSASTDRTDGFTNYLKGTYAYNGSKIETPWTDTSSITYSGALDWSQSNCQSYFETYMSTAGNSDTKYIAGWDDGYVLGVLDALEGSAIDEATKTAFLANKPFITGCGGAEGVYAILRGDDTDYKDVTGSFGGIMSVTYPPAMIQTTITTLVDYLDGKTVVQDNVQSAEMVTSKNVANFQSFK